MPSVLEFDFCKILQKFLCVFLILLCVTVRQLDVTGDASHIVGVKHTPSCPATLEEWKKQAETWNCQSIKATLKYHCLLNHWRNETLELCGEEKDIIGKNCPEFNQRGNRIQANWEHKCNESNPPCPFKYKSSEVFKYPACLKLERTIDDDDDDDDDIKEDSDDTVRISIITITIVFFLAILIISPLIYNFCFKGTGNKSKETKLTTEEVSNKLAGNKKMYSQGKDPSTILQDENKTLINFSN